MAALGTKKYMGLAALGTKMYQGQPALRYKNVPGAASPRYIFGTQGWGYSNLNIRISLRIFKCPGASPNVTEMNIEYPENSEYPEKFGDIQI